MKNYIWIIILAAGMLCGCDEVGDVDNVEVLKSMKTDIPIEKYLRVDVGTINLNADNSTQQLKISSNIAWTLECSENWIKLSTNGGTGDMTVNLTISENPSEDERSGIIIIKGANGTNLTVIVKQSGNENAQRDPSKDDNIPPS